jgi:hypothetical protein
MRITSTTATKLKSPCDSTPDFDTVDYIAKLVGTHKLDYILESY